MKANWFAVCVSGLIGMLIVSSCGGGGGGGSSSDGGLTGSATNGTDGSNGTNGSSNGTTNASTNSTTNASTNSTTGSVPDLGVNANMNGYRPFPPDNAWNTPVDQEPVDPNSDNLIASIGAGKEFHPDFGANWNGGPFGIPYVVVSGSQAKVPMSFDYDDESDPGPYPIPTNPPVENGGDRHILVIDRDNHKLYETWDSHAANPGWHCGSGALFDLTSNALRPAGWTSADAAGLPIFPGLVRYDEVHAGEIAHALRFTVSITRKAYIAPARHWASSNTSANRPPMGMRVRLKANFNLSAYPESAQVILRALKRYGMIVADNGSDWYLSGAPDSRWNDEELDTLKNLRGSDFEVVKMGTIVGG